MQKYDVIKRPLVTERAVNSAETQNTYIFRVDPYANKHQIKESIEAIYDVKVLNVRTALVKGKPRTYRRAFHSHESVWKKAYVTLRETDYIDLI